jgi:transposase
MDKDALIAFLKQQNQTQQGQINELLKKLDDMQAKLDLLLHKLYGKKSEKKPPSNPDNDPPPKPPKSSKGSNTTKDGKPKNRREFPEDMRREITEYDLSDVDKQCSCGRTKHRIGKEVSEYLDIVPAEFFVQQHVRYKYGCRCGCGVAIAKMPAQPIEKGIPAAGLLADVIISKYEDSMPLYRQMMRFERHGMIILDNTLCDWIAQSAFMLEPIVQEMKKDLLRSIKIHSDDTPVPVLNEGKTRLGRIWVYATDAINTAACTIYDYTRTRAQSGPIDFLGDYEGYLQADAYSGYDKLYASNKIIEVGCMAHCRRKFYDVSVAAKGESSADRAIELIQKLYVIEDTARNMSETQRYYYRRKHAKPILKQVKRWLNKIEPTLIPKTPIAQAVQYMQNQWRALCRYLSHGALHIDNNFGERAMRIIAIGRKNWLFAGSDEGGKRAAILYSILRTCKQNLINPFAYLRDVLARIPNTKQKDIRSLLPYHWHADVTA